MFVGITTIAGRLDLMSRGASIYKTVTAELIRLAYLNS
jgi:hypothetical protein